MARPQLTEVTGLLKAWSDGDPTALDRLAAKVHRELHGMARRYMKNERAGNTLQTTALVNEVYLRLLIRPELVGRTVGVARELEATKSFQK